MAREKTAILDAGETFPSLELATVCGRNLKVPEDFLGNWSVLLFLRGDW
jgi:peroxiredoxin